MIVPCGNCGVAATIGHVCGEGDILADLRTKLAAAERVIEAARQLAECECCDILSCNSQRALSASIADYDARKRGG